MGRITGDRHISFDYNKEFIEMWESQPDHLKTFLEETAAPYGYTGQNLFYVLVWRYTIRRFSTRAPWYWTRKNG